MNLWKRLRLLKKKAKRTLVVLGVGVGTYLTLVPMGFCEDTASIITDWMPTIVSFAMLGMVLGLLKKFGGSGK